MKNLNLLKNNSYLLDLGSCPGGWSQVVSKVITSGKILSIDIKPMKPIKNVSFLRAIFLITLLRLIFKNFLREKLDVIISDMAADTTGNKSLELDQD